MKLINMNPFIIRSSPQNQTSNTAPFNMNTGSPATQALALLMQAESDALEPLCHPSPHNSWNNTANAALTMAIAKPATRRMRTIPVKKNSDQDDSSACSTVVYVGHNPVLKKTAKMLRKKVPSKKTQKNVPKRASSKTHLAKHASSADIPRAPRRKASNPFLCQEEGEQIMTRSRSKQRLEHEQEAAHAPHMPCRKASDPFLSSFVSSASPSPTVMPVSQGTIRPIMTRSRSKEHMQATAAILASEATFPKLEKKYVSFMDLHWDQLSLHDAAVAAGQKARAGGVPKNRRHSAPPERPTRKSSIAMDLDQM